MIDEERFGRVHSALAEAQESARGVLRAMNALSGLESSPHSDPDVQSRLVESAERDLDEALERGVKGAEGMIGQCGHLMRGL